ncbi:alpha/beta fold hydrolase [Paenibacillus koleovorans]|uniref:alpha/beta fold hydrolase n=1 Tax=Paenibacillus koleovorans TaxID=121608 RepID=UPI0013E2A502|nr:alpha/beta hydrolase [Paenibacillus koleovorans]
MAHQQDLSWKDPFYIGLDNQDPAEVVLGTAFQAEIVEVNGAALHFVSGGSGRAIIFIHGFSQDWYAFKEIMRLLVNEYLVIAVDLRGMGKSKATQDDFDAVTLANDIYALTKHLDIHNPYIVGHDMGGMVAYAYARLYPNETRGVAILDAPLPGTPSTDLMVKMPFLWHFGFHRIPKLPERLIGGRVYGYFRKAFFTRFAKNKQAMTEADMRHYASAYGSREQLQAGLGLYRTYRQNQLFMRAHREELNVPILLIESDYGSSKPGPTAKQLQEQFGCRTVTAIVVEGCGHFMPEEQPQSIAKLIRSNA